MSFAGCIGTLMANTGLPDLVKSAFGGVKKMLSGKYFPQNTRSLPVCVEEILRSVLQDESVSDFDNMMVLLNSLSKKSRTAHLWLEALIWLFILIMRFVSREADWPLHIHTLKLMLPYFAVFGHWHHLSYASVYFIKVTKLPKNLLKKFLDGQYAMWHKNGI